MNHTLIVLLCKKTNESSSGDINIKKPENPKREDPVPGPLEILQK